MTAEMSVGNVGSERECVSKEGEGETEAVADGSQADAPPSRTASLSQTPACTIDKFPSTAASISLGLSLQSPKEGQPDGGAEAHTRAASSTPGAAGAEYSRPSRGPVQEEEDKEGASSARHVPSFDAYVQQQQQQAPRHAGHPHFAPVAHGSGQGAPLAYFSAPSSYHQPTPYRSSSSHPFSSSPPSSFGQSSSQEHHHQPSRGYIEYVNGGIPVFRETRPATSVPPRPSMAGLPAALARQLAPSMAGATPEQLRAAVVTLLNGPLYQDLMAGNWERERVTVQELDGPAFRPNQASQSADREADPSNEGTGRPEREHDGHAGAWRKVGDVIQIAEAAHLMSVLPLPQDVGKQQQQQQQSQQQQQPQQPRQQLQQHHHHHHRGGGGGGGGWDRESPSSYGYSSQQQQQQHQQQQHHHHYHQAQPQQRLPSHQSQHQQFGAQQAQPPLQYGMQAAQVQQRYGSSSQSQQGHASSQYGSSSQPLQPLSSSQPLPSLPHQFGSVATLTGSSSAPSYSSYLSAGDESAARVMASVMCGGNLRDRELDLDAERSRDVVGASDLWAMQPGGDMRAMVKRRKVETRRLRKNFDLWPLTLMPQKEAASALGLTTQRLSKYWVARHGTRRWPSRQTEGLIARAHRKYQLAKSAAAQQSIIMQLRSAVGAASRPAEVSVSEDQLAAMSPIRDARIAYLRESCWWWPQPGEPEIVAAPPPPPPTPAQQHQMQLQMAQRQVMAQQGGQLGTQSYGSGLGHPLPHQHAPHTQQQHLQQRFGGGRPVSPQAQLPIQQLAALQQAAAPQRASLITGENWSLATGEQLHYYDEPPLLGVQVDEEER